MKDHTPHNQSREQKYLEKDFPLGNFKKNEIYQSDETFKKEVISKKTEIFDLSIVKDNNEINCGELGKLLEGFQSVIHSLALTKEGKYNSVSEETKNKSNLIYSATFMSPFTIRLIDGRPPDLFSKTDIEMYGKYFIKLLSYTDKPDEIINKIQQYNNLTKKRFTKFLTILIDSSFDIKVRWAIISNRYQSKKFITNRENIRESLKALQKYQAMQENIFTYKGKLVAINIKNDFFALQLESGETMRGKLSKALKSGNFKIPSRVKTDILEKMKFCELTQSTKYYYELLRLEVL